ncbi:MAG: ABC transporter permease [bacterium]
MASYLFRRLVSSLLLLLALLTLVFFLIHAAPGDPIDRYLSDEIDAEQRERLRHNLGLDQPLPVQYRRWLEGVVCHFDFGLSLRQHRPVATILLEAVPNTLLLTVSAYLIHLLAAVSGGIFMAHSRGRPLERLVNISGLTLYSLPGFWLGLMMILLFSRQLGWLPMEGVSAPDAAFLPWHEQLWDRLRHLVMPACVLGLGSAMSTARYVRNSMLEVLSQDYVLTARAKGLPERVVLGKHALRNGLLPLITLIGLNLPLLLGGAVVIEYIFAWPGMGRVAIEAIQMRDYPVILGTTALSAVLVVLGSFLADLAYTAADPRVRLTGRRP